MLYLSDSKLADDGLHALFLTDPVMANLTPERRLTMRVHRIWLKAAAGHSYPRRSQIDPIQIGADWANCLMIDLDRVPSLSRFSYVGSALRDARWPTFERQCVGECLDDTLLELVTKRIAELLENNQPLTFAGAAFHQDANILYRTILLPLSEDGVTIDGLLAAIGYREVTADEALSAVPASLAKSGSPRDISRR
jgi:hypothetical protein